MTQANIAPYNEIEFREKFQHTDIYRQLCNDYDDVSFENTVEWDWPPTPRERMASARKSRFSAVPFYYLEYLTRHNPEHIYDMGCGANYFRKYIPNIIGIGNEPIDNKHFKGQLHGKFDDQWVRENQSRFQSIFSICSLHFIPFTAMRQRVLDFASTLAPGGRAYLALNTSRMIERMMWDKVEHNSSVNFSTPRPEMESMIRQQLSDMPFTYEVFDVNIEQSGHRCLRHDYRPQFDDVIDGNIRIVIWNNKI
jgi:hypothetical protein